MTTSSPEPKKIRRRLPRQEREHLIVEEAIRFFAEVGFEGQTRALALRLGVTQPLLYRYFPDKDALIERVYTEVFEGSWNPAWGVALADRTRPVEDRLLELYRAYARENFSYERVRLFMYAGLKDRDLASRYLGFLRDNMFIPVAREIHVAAGLDATQPPSEAEIEAAAGLHGAIGYVGLRRWVYQSDTGLDVDATLTTLVSTFVRGALAAARG